MSEHTGIAWTDHTLNLISGCTKISAGCTNCYAANLPPSMRRHAEWGPDAERKFAPESYIAQVYAWQRRAAKTGVRERVFGPSVADPFEGPHNRGREGRDGPREDYLPVLARMFQIAAECPDLDFQVLTKRPWNAVAWWRKRGGTWPANLWIGTSTEDQRAAGERVPYLLQLPARVRFLSAEPLLGRVSLDKLWCHNCETDEHVRFEPPAQPWCIECDSEVGPAGWLDGLADERQRGINWIIVGGESGRNARPCDLVWIADIVRQCCDADVPVFVKQLGAAWAESTGAQHKKGGDPAEWPADLRVQEFPHA